MSQIPISQILTMQPNQQVVGSIQATITDVKTQYAATGQWGPYTNQKLTLQDQSGSIEATLWNSPEVPASSVGQQVAYSAYQDGKGAWKGLQAKTYEGQKQLSISPQRQPTGPTPVQLIQTPQGPAIAAMPATQQQTLPMTAHPQQPAVQPAPQTVPATAPPPVNNSRPTIQQVISWVELCIAWAEAHSPAGYGDVAKREVAGMLYMSTREFIGKIPFPGLNPPTTAGTQVPNPTRFDEQGHDLGPTNQPQIDPATGQPLPF